MSSSKALCTSSLLAAACFSLVLLAACSVNVKKNADESDKKVDIETPFGGIHVSKEADVKDIGLPVYPGARPAQEESKGEDKSANVNISSSVFGLRVVAQEFDSDDPPEKLIGFYTTELKKYGKVLDCKSSWQAGGHVSVHHDNPAKESHELTCDNESDGRTTELKVGLKENQRIVAIKPEGKKTKFALVRVQLRSKDNMI
ncbi:MAG: hypothetical protein DMG90_11405 [Acidobacteria bacterium]|nr:MAG: hypothetical protein DMG90_11405 [Acidobacteriota bacterium]PYY09421.1 MAG: hypothetical protein DMG69_10455 [Acidobacteriota bacterium]